MDTFPLHLIPLAPLAGAVINLLVGRRLGRLGAGFVACAAVGTALLLGWYAAFLLWQSGAPSMSGAFFSGDWLVAREANPHLTVHVGAGLLFDHLSAVMVLVVTTVGFLIHLYSLGYMAEDPNLARYFGYLNLFTGAMLILVLGDSLPVTFVGWEGVGLCSYLLIGFWFTKEQNAYAGRKAFIVNRIGDFGFLLGMLLIFSAASTLKYEELVNAHSHAALSALVGGRVAIGAIGALLLFVGATGKSAQLPLYVWLPDAMAGPTPVSALIHAATMVTAGVYMVARLHFLFELDAVVSGVVSMVGAVTALFAATMGITQKPIKKILAYSTISQLGFMFVGVGTHAYASGLFHLVTHAFFKAGLFLGAGSIMHALGGEEDVTQMGGLRKKMPITWLTFLVYCIAIAGIFPSSGFFSKDAILASAFAFDYPELGTWPHWLGGVVYGLVVTAALCTAFYMFRAYFLVFHGEFRGPREKLEHAHESPSTMTIPLVLLAVGAAALGLLGVPEVFWPEMNRFEHWLVPSMFAPEISHLGHAKEWALMGLATAVSLIGIAGAYLLYGRGLSPQAGTLARRLAWLHRTVDNKYYVDEIYDRLIVRPLRGLATFSWKVVDSFVIDLVMVRGSAAMVDVFGRGLRFVQSGDAQRYVAMLAVGAAATVGIGSHWAVWRAASFQVEQQGLEVVVHAAATPSVKRPLEYVFRFGDGSPEVRQTAPTARHRYDQPGERKIRLEVRDPRWETRWGKTVVVKP